MQAEAAPLPALVLPLAWPVCLRAMGLLPAALVRPGEGDQGTGHVPPSWHVLGGTHGSGSRSTSRRGHGPLGLCNRAQTPSRCVPGLTLGTTGRGPISAGATNGTAGFACRPAAGVAVGGILRGGAPAVSRLTPVATRAGPRDVGGAGPGSRPLATTGCRGSCCRYGPGARC